ncbi:hypothetical protein [Frondihabitans australicus]|uniref:tRNA-guanine family transglycosylase n=1 Tax=Frondihabitans australicus TaxID=386892 RepID=A0A495IGG6_9MICO|nr:hypothetical protein [Frondihabitans australicus]RKR74750.1 hypothetical protein C8E83_1879 [Frondihabitans australicus]
MAKFRHFLSYGSTDQETARSLTGYFDGLIVPGTIAAFQAEGTKGFVLSLSARSNEPYAIDSRFPLFQNSGFAWKKSHFLLAQVLGLDQYVSESGSRELRPADFDEALVAKVAEGWLRFNVDFEDVRMKVFDKYAKRLPDDDIKIEDAQAPAWIMPPYLMVDGLEDPWRTVGDRIWEASVRLAAGPNDLRLRRVIAGESAAAWDQLLRVTPEHELAGWVSHLDELDASTAGRGELLTYGRAIHAASTRGQRIFALYGGFFSVLLHRYGLEGSSHGVGYGEQRDYIELPTSGAPPARFYVPRLHRYIGVDIAGAIWDQAPELVECLCPDCKGRSPMALDYHELMRHSVRVRSAEIAEWTPLATGEASMRLRQDFRDYSQLLPDLALPRAVARRAEGLYVHLESWAWVLDRV